MGDYSFVESESELVGQRETPPLPATVGKDPPHTNLVKEPPIGHPNV